MQVKSDYFQPDTCNYCGHYIPSCGICDCESWSIEETVDGQYIALLNGFQQFGDIDTSGAGNMKFATYWQALNHIRNT